MNRKFLSITSKKQMESTGRARSTCGKGNERAKEERKDARSSSLASRLQPIHARFGIPPIASSSPPKNLFLTKAAVKEGEEVQLNQKKKNEEDEFSSRIDADSRSSEESAARSRASGELLRSRLCLLSVIDDAAQSRNTCSLGPCTTRGTRETLSFPLSGRREVGKAAFLQVRPQTSASPASETLFGIFTLVYTPCLSRSIVLVLSVYGLKINKVGQER